jgi:hypothetical protein
VLSRQRNAPSKADLRRAIEQSNIFQFSEIFDRLLIDKSFDLNGEDEYGQTLLGKAVEDGRLEEIIRYF